MDDNAVVLPHWSVQLFDKGEPTSRGRFEGQGDGRRRGLALPLHFLLGFYPALQVR